MQNHDWILEVLQDLAEYAGRNSLNDLSEMILDAEFIALAEIAKKSKRSNFSKLCT